ncbi:MAG TPA: hypothetical protein VHI72_07420 [Hyphomicrobiaceae bacterium]|jgi:hypothetical protein|nr:hypothetical protein [Hyphomicrobiaceae bacterium]
MRAVTALIIALLALGVPVTAAPANKAAVAPTKGEFASSESILRWINGYRAKPEPAKAPMAARAMSELNLFRDLETAGVYIGFLSGVLESNPKKAEALIAKMFPMPPEDQVVIVRAIAYSNLPDWKALLLKFAERMPARQGLIDRFVNDKMPALKQLPLDTGAAPLDMLWGKYFATGSYEPIVRMVSILEWSKDQNNVDRLTVGSMAKLTLATNASRDKELMDMLKMSIKHETKENRVVLQEVIEAAETFEFGRVRKEAMGAIDQLKIKGPASSRNVQWWGTAGQTALALGCIVAGALGQVQVGIPCVVGGAVSGAALKYMTPQ